MKVKLKRRRFGQLGLVSAVAAAFGNLTKNTFAQTSPKRPTPAGQTFESAGSVEVKLRVNGASQSLTIEPRVTLLDVLRERIGLTGTKKGCNHGQCGACTVLVDGRRVNSCLILAVMTEGAEITTIEGLAKADELHPMQAAFIKHDGFQCGYCTPGQVCSAVGMLSEIAAGTASALTVDVRESKRSELTGGEIRERMSGNICRCGAYPGIVAAVHEVGETVRYKENYETIHLRACPKPKYSHQERRQ